MSVKVLYNTGRGPQTDILENGIDFKIDDKNNLIVVAQHNGKMMYAQGTWTSAQISTD